MRELAVSMLIKGADSLPVTRHIINPCHRGVSCMQDAPCWSARCFSNTPPLLSISLRSCPNDDPRPTFNHYLHCPFNNYSTPLHNFNCRSMRWIPVIVNCLIDTIFWGYVFFFPHKIWCIQRKWWNILKYCLLWLPLHVLLMLYHARQACFHSICSQVDWGKVEASYTNLFLKCHSLPLLRGCMNSMVKEKA